MSTAKHSGRLGVQRLIEGDHLEQSEFHRRYEAGPAGLRAELIEGVVFMPSPVGRGHGKAHVLAIVWLDRYAEVTPGVEVLDNTTTILSTESETQPEVLLRILPECYGQSQDERGFIGGAPELVVEIAEATRFVDLGPKLAAYERAGVREYIVRALNPDAIIWHSLRNGRLGPIAPDADGLYRSEVFSGLWLNPTALLSEDRVGLRAALEAGARTPEHAEFVARLAARRRGTPED